MNVAEQKKSHAFHLCPTAEAFLDQFERAAGRPLSAFVGRFAVSDRVAACVLVGSIPLGIGSSASDVDVLVLIDGADALRDQPRGLDDDEDVVFSGRSDDTSALVAAEVIAMIGGVEVDFEFIVGDRVREAARRVTRSRVALAGQEIRILSRLKTGWILQSRSAIDDVCAALRADQSLEVHCAVTNFVFALQDLEDARAALPGDVALALHLGRSCVERGFASYFATKGYAYLGSKWLRLLRAPDAALRPLASVGLGLLFPTLDDGAAQVEGYLADVAGFLAVTRDAIQTGTADKVFRVAFTMCPQVYDPRAVSRS